MFYYFTSTTIHKNQYVTLLIYFLSAPTTPSNKASNLFIV